MRILIDTNIVTRLVERGHLHHANAASAVKHLEARRDERTIFEHWQELVVQFDVKGKVGHDARLVAAMKRHNLTHILTFNAADFARYDGISVFTPAQVLASLAK